MGSARLFSASTSGFRAGGYDGRPELEEIASSDSVSDDRGVGESQILRFTSFNRLGLWFDASRVESNGG